MPTVRTSGRSSNFVGAPFGAVDAFGRDAGEEADATGIGNDVKLASDLIGALGNDQHDRGATPGRFGSEITTVFATALNGTVLRSRKPHLAVVYFAGHGWSNELAGTPCPTPIVPGALTNEWKAAMSCEGASVTMTGGEWCLTPDTCDGSAPPLCPFGVRHFCAALQWALAQAGGRATPCHVIVVCDNCHAAGWVDGLGAAFKASGLDEMNVTVTVQAACRTDETNPGELFCPTWVKLNTMTSDEVHALIAMFWDGSAAVEEDPLIHPVWASHGYAPATPTHGSPIVTVGGVHYFVDPAFFAFVAAALDVSADGASDRIKRRRSAQTARLDALGALRVRVHVCLARAAVVPRLRAHCCLCSALTRLFWNPLACRAWFSVIWCRCC